LEFWMLDVECWMLNNWRSFWSCGVDFRLRMRKPRGRPSTGWRRRGMARKPWVRQWRGQGSHLSVAKENGASFWICLVCRNRHFGPFVYLPSEARCRALRGNRVDEWEAGQQRECCDKFVTRVTESSQKKVFVKCPQPCGAMRPESCGALGVPRFRRAAAFLLDAMAALPQEWVKPEVDPLGVARCRAECESGQDGHKAWLAHR
jgi:hypothetical protein